jgi:hypothetical protein
MRKTRFFGFSVTVVLILAGCSTFRAMGGVTSVSRDVNVTAAGADGCAIANDIAQVDVTNKNNANIVWNVKPASDFKFTSDGIKFVAKPGHGVPDAGQIVKTNSSDTTWTVHDKNTQAGRFGYEVNVVRKAGGTPCKLDPTIFNDGTCDPSSGPC